MTQQPQFPDRPDSALASMLRDVGPQPPTKVDIGVAVGQARRRIRRRRILTAVTAAAVTFLSVAAVPTALDAVSHRDGERNRSVPAASASPPTACTLRRLAEPEGSFQSYVTAADPTGRYIAARTYFTQGTKLRQRIWDDGTPRDVDIPGEDGSFEDINSHGVAVGASFVSKDAKAAWIYRDGKVTQLAGGNATASGINDRGDVVGVVHKGIGRELPVIWRGGRGAPLPLALPAGATDGTAKDVSEDGRIVGSVGNADTFPRTTHPYIWSPDGAGRQLPLARQQVSAAAETIRGDWVVSRGTKSGKSAEALIPATLRWNLRADSPASLLQYSDATINTLGWVAGGHRGGAALDTGTTPVTLPGLGGDQNSLVVNLTDDGRLIAGVAHETSGRMHAVEWRCA